MIDWLRENWPMAAMLLGGGMLIVGITAGIIYGSTPASPKMEVIAPTPEAASEGPRFKAESVGYFKAGYEKNIREILVLTDRKTGRQYLAVTGCGTTELRKHTETDSDGNAKTHVEEE